MSTQPQPTDADGAGAAEQAAELLAETFAQARRVVVSGVDADR